MLRSSSVPRQALARRPPQTVRHPEPHAGSEIRHPAGVNALIRPGPMPGDVLVPGPAKLEPVPISEAIPLRQNVPLAWRIRALASEVTPPESVVGRDTLRHPQF